MRRTVTRAALALAAVAAPAAAAAQDGGWNSGRALELIQRAQERRQVALSDTGMVDYQADARGYIYFYLDRRDTGERTLVKTDQVALDVFWKAPNLSRQRIIGLRDERSLPTNIRYHEDHLTVVQDNFGDLIRLGDGDEVADVLHPAAPAGPLAYDYRLADSTTIRLPGAEEPVRVYKVQVRPKDASRPALVGSVYVDRRGGDIVRMEFTFTPVSYVDDQLDYINVLLENGLYKGRFWLPNRQQVELRRQVPELGLPAGGMIRGTMRIGNYRFNQGLDRGLFAGRRVVSVPVAQREAFAFEQPIDAELREAGLSAAGELGDIRREAAELVGRRLLSGLPGTRIDLSSATGTLRYNRAEGLAIGPGVRFNPGERLSLGVRGGYATAAKHLFGEAELWRGALPDRIGIGVYANLPRDVGVGPVGSGAMSSLTALLAGYDFTDPYYATGAELRVDRAVGGGWDGAFRLRVENHESARLATDFSLLGGGSHFRPVMPIDEGEFYGATVSLRRPVPAEVARGFSLGVSLEGALTAQEGLEGHWRPRVDAGWVTRGSGGSELWVEASAGAAAGDVPRQQLFLLGGRGTVPGYAFRAWGGDRFALARATYAAELFRPFVRGRVFAAAGWAGQAGTLDPFTGGVVRPPLNLRTGGMVSVGAGLGLLFDIIRVDVARGLGEGGVWEVIVEANPSFWDFL
ncbi:MAG: hypothetical protein KY467_10970 [Gemmatimonadetes bacterium]|nr:hypothetical protein [Gemmatimonadota bacterium]